MLSWWVKFGIHELGTWVSGLDFNPEGTLVATIDRYGTCLISDLNTDNYKFHKKIGNKKGNFMINLELKPHISMLLDDAGLCRWTCNSGESILFIKYDGNQLNLFDLEKQSLLLNTALKLEKSGSNNRYYTLANIELMPSS